MQGMWKNNIGGWNHKGTRRKRQTQKHFMKDKAKTVYRIFDGKKTHQNDNRVMPEVFRRENEIVKVFDNKVYQKEAQVYNALVTWKTYSQKQVLEEREFMDGSKREIFVWKYFTHLYSKKMKVYKDPYIKYYTTPYRDLKTGLKIDSLLDIRVFSNDLEVHLLSSTYDKVSLDWKSQKARDEKPQDIHNYNQNIFVYNKAINKKTFWRYWNDGRRRKYAQKMAHHKDRAKVRQYISKGNWDEEIKTHAYSKSIAWWVH